MKKMIINWLLPQVIDLAIAALVKLAHMSDNTIDDEMVGTLIANQDKLISEIKANL